MVNALVGPSGVVMARLEDNGIISIFYDQPMSTFCLNYDGEKTDQNVTCQFSFSVEGVGVSLKEAIADTSTFFPNDEVEASRMRDL